MSLGARPVPLSPVPLSLVPLGPAPINPAPISPVRIGLVGYGTGGRYFHAPLISSLAGAVFAGVVTRSPERRVLLHREHPGVAACDSVTELLSRGVDLVTVSIPPQQRTMIVHELIDAGITVVVDKPFAMTVPEARELITHANAAGVMLSVFQNRRWDSEALTVARVAASGVLGTIRLVESALDRWEPHSANDQSGGGWLLDLGSHLVDQVLTIFGPAVTVFAELDRSGGIAGERSFLILIEHASGIQSRVSANSVQNSFGPRFKVSGDDATLVITGLDIQTDQVLAGETPASLGAGWGVEPRERWAQIVRQHQVTEFERVSGDWMSFYRLTADAVRQGTAPPVTAESAFDTLVVLDAALRSWRTERVVRL